MGRWIQKPDLTPNDMAQKAMNDVSRTSRKYLLGLVALQVIGLIAIYFILRMA